LLGKRLDTEVDLLSLQLDLDNTVLSVTEMGLRVILTLLLP